MTLAIPTRRMPSALRMTELVDGVPDAVRDLLVNASGRKDFQLDISDYRAGSVLLLAR